MQAGSPQARQRIAGLFWPESTDAQALTKARRSYIEGAYVYLGMSLCHARPAHSPRRPLTPAAAPGWRRHSFSAGPLSSARSRTRGGPRWRGAVVWSWSAVALALGRPAW